MSTKTQPGGFHEGLCNPAYDSPGRKRLPIAAAEKQSGREP